MSNTMSEEDQIFQLRTQIASFLKDAPYGREALCFTENLDICAKNETTSGTKTVGVYCISVEATGPQSRGFLVNIAASMKFETEDNCMTGRSKIIGSVDENFRCLEEKRTEFLHRTNGQHEKCIYIESEDDSYYVNVRARCSCDTVSRSCIIAMKNYPGFMSEAGNILLMRYLALTNYHGLLTLEPITIDGKIETCDYRCISAQWKKMNGRRLEVYSIEKRKRRDQSQIDEAIKSNNPKSDGCYDTKSLLTRQGRILRHEWSNLAYVLRINPRVDPEAIGIRKCFAMQLPLKQTWPDYLELMCKYLDKKSCEILQKKHYFADHPEIVKLMADYTQAVLTVQPIDVLSFTVQYFRAFTVFPEQP